MKVQLKDGRSATLEYVGKTEEERMQNAIDVTFLEEVRGRMANRGDLTPTVEEVITRCIQERIIVTPDPVEQQPELFEDDQKQPPAPTAAPVQRRVRQPPNV